MSERRRRGRPPGSGDGMTQSSVRLPLAMHDRLASSPFGLGEEIRRRIAWSFANDDGHTDRELWIMEEPQR